jgi:hypothetical protein
MKYDEVKLGEETRPSLVPILGAAVVFPLSVLFWLSNYCVGVITSSDDDESDMIEGQILVTSY